MKTTLKVLEENTNMRLDVVAAAMFSDFSRTQLKKWILQGRVLVNGEICSPKDTVYRGDEIEVHPLEENKVSWDPEKIEFEVAHEEEDFLIINKPHGLVMHPGSGCLNGTLANGLLYKYPELINLPRCGIVHRLDKDTSGVLVVARTDSFRNYFIQEMQERRVKKDYIAISVGETIGSFEINEPIGRDERNRTKMAIRHDGKESISFIKLKRGYKGYVVLDVSIETGRTHQIRVHLAAKNLPIIGDATYNSRKKIGKESSDELIQFIRDFPRQALHATYLSFQHQKNDQLFEWSIPMPEDMQKLEKAIISG
jgi:23S rRNA pseudouridine1911/1915/1917 synthase